MQVVIRMTEEEKKQLRVYAGENNMNMSDFIKKLIKVYGESRTQHTEHNWGYVGNRPNS